VETSVRVLHVITGLNAGGAEHQLGLLLGHQRSDAEVVTLTNPGLVAQAIRAEGVPVYELDMGGNTDLTALPRLVRLIHDGQYDVVHTHLYRACVYGRVAARLAGVPLVLATEHSLGDERIEGRSLTAGIRRLYLATERMGAATIAVSSTVAGRLARWGVPAHRIHVIGNGIDAAAYAFDPMVRDRIRVALGIEPDRYVVGVVGRLVPGKRVEQALRALGGRSGLVALVVGDGPLRTSLVAIAAAIGLPSVFTGESAEVPALMSAMDLLVAPSQEETFGLAVVEALAAGLPVLYAACPAVDDQAPALPVPARRLLPDLSDLDVALDAALAAGPVRSTPPALVRRYDIAEVAQRVDQLYADLHPRAGTPFSKGAAHG
jgi:glycosyltransferase involved in cell wall biosynthesis